MVFRTVLEILLCASKILLMLFAKKPWVISVSYTILLILITSKFSKDDAAFFNGILDNFGHEHLCVDV